MKVLPAGKLITKQQLIDASLTSQAEGYNQQFDTDALARELPDHLYYQIRPLMVHRHKDGKRCAPHYRCVVEFHDEQGGLLDLAFIVYEAL